VLRVVRVSMVLALVIGDMHIPHRAADLPTKFKELLVPGKIQHVICTGNLCSKDALDWLKGLCGGGTSALHVVEGDFDDDFTTLPQSKVVNIGDFRIGVTHGHAIVPWGDIEALKSVQRLMDVDVLVTGHTHAFAAYKVNGDKALIINPGSATGAFTPLRSDVKPSFVLMDIEGSRIVVYVYELLPGDELKVDKIVWNKDESTS